ncbi:MAG: AAA family ATPase, partial [Deltaproteobacteria bacterium]|nr:AAA family ATPase [Deltaproteobacteria bacterium]
MKTLIIGERQNVRDAIKAALEPFSNLSVEGEALTLDTGTRLIDQLSPSLVLLDLGDDPTRCFSFIQKLGQSHPRTAFIAISEKDAGDLIIKALRSGASDFLMLPLSQDDLERAIEKVGRVAESRQEIQPHLGKVISLFDSKGGSGATTIATNVAANIVQTGGRTACVVDLDLQMGDVSVFLDLRPKFTLVDVTKNIQRLDTRFLEDSLARHSSGVAVLAHPEDVMDTQAIKPEQIRRVLRLLRSMFDFVIIDTCKTFDESTIEAFESSDLIVLVSTVDLPAIRNSRRCLNMFRRFGYGNDKVKLVFNREAKSNEITLKQAEKVLNYPIFW